jgi:hypothetical protein
VKWPNGLIIASLLLIGSAPIQDENKKTSCSFEVLSQMSQEDRYYLSVFLCTILFYDDFSYLLFGSKPIAYASFDKPVSFRFSYGRVFESDLELSRGFNVFEKNKHLFLSDNIAVRFYEDNELLEILMINKKNLLKMLEVHINDFKLVLGPEVSIESLYAKITAQENLAQVVNNHDALFGILLGYGRNNAWLFHRKSTIFRELNTFNPPKKRKAFLEKEWAKVAQKMTFFSEESCGEKYTLKTPRLPLLHFMADPSSLETKQLKAQYRKEREEMKKLFAKQGWLEATLQKLMSE